MLAIEKITRHIKQQKHNLRNKASEPDMAGMLELSDEELKSNYAFPAGSVVKIPPASAGDLGSVPGLGRSPGEGNGNPLQYSCLENLMDRGAW